jgi:hypothetical protein
LPERDCVRIFELIDVDDSGTISIAEFTAWLHGGGGGGGGRHAPARGSHQFVRSVAVVDEEEKHTRVAFGSGLHRTVARERPKETLQQRVLEQQQSLAVEQARRSRVVGRVAHRQSVEEEEEMVVVDEVSVEGDEYCSTEDKSKHRRCSGGGADGQYSTRIDAGKEYWEESELSDGASASESTAANSTLTYDAFSEDTLFFSERSENDGEEEEENEHRLTLYDDDELRHGEESVAEHGHHHVTVTWPVARMSDSKHKLVRVAKTYAANQRDLLAALAVSSDEIIALGTKALEASEIAKTLEIQMSQVRLSSLAVIHASSDRRRLAKLLRVWHSWFLKQRAKRSRYRANRRVLIVSTWSAWCRFLYQSKFRSMQEQHLFLIGLQDQHALVASQKILARAIKLGHRRLPLRQALRLWTVWAIEQRL